MLDTHILRLKLIAMRAYKYEERKDLLQNLSEDSYPQIKEIKNVLEGDSWIEEYLRMITFFVSHVKILSPEDVRSRFLSAQEIVFEGAQGVLLDQVYGFYLSF